MEEKEFKKSYTGFNLWLVGFVTISCAVCFLPIKDTHMMVRIIMNICMISVALLAFIVYKADKIYWYNGISYEEAKEAGTERRKICAWKHFKIFGIYALLYLVCSCILQVRKVTIGVDLVWGTIGLVAAAIKTMPIKL